MPARIFVLILFLSAESFSYATSLKTVEQSSLNKVLLSMEIFRQSVGRYPTNWTELDDKTGELISETGAKLGHPVGSRYAFVNFKMAFPAIPNANVVLIRSVPLERVNESGPKHPYRHRYVIVQTSDGLLVTSVEEEKVQRALRDTGARVSRTGDMPDIEFEQRDRRLDTIWAQTNATLKQPSGDPDGERR